MYIQSEAKIEVITVRVERGIKDELRRAANARGMTLTHLLVEAALDKIKDEERPYVGVLRRMMLEGKV